MDAPTRVAMVKPKVIERMIDKTEPITDIVPLMPHMTGMASLRLLWPKRAKPLGKGIPIKNPALAAIKEETIILPTTCNPAVASNIMFNDSSKMRQTIAAKMGGR